MIFTVVALGIGKGALTATILSEAIWEEMNKYNIYSGMGLKK